jgi:hypothetical protein
VNTALYALCDARDALATGAFAANPWHTAQTGVLTKTFMRMLVSKLSLLLLLAVLCSCGGGRHSPPAAPTTLNWDDSSTSWDNQNWE